MNVEGLTKSQTFSVEPVYYNYDGDKLDASRLTCNVETVEVSINLLQTKKVDLKVETTGEVAKGYALESVLLEPKSIVVAGTKDKLADLSEILVTGLSIDGLKKDTEENIDITDYLPEDIKLAQDNPDVRVKVQVVPLDKRTIEVPVNKITVRNPNIDYRLEFLDDMISVTVRGEKDEIEDITLEDLKPVIDVSDLAVGEYELQVELQDLSQGYYDNEPTVKIRLTEKEATNSSEE